MPTRISIALLALLSFCSIAYADCVYGAKSKSSYVVLDSKTIMLTGGFGSDIIIKTYSYITRYSSISVLKDSFCSYENSVLYVDGNVVDASQVTKVN